MNKQIRASRYDISKIYRRCSSNGNRCAIPVVLFELKEQVDSRLHI